MFPNIYYCPPPFPEVNTKKGSNVISIIRSGEYYQYPGAAYQYQYNNLPQLHIDEQSLQDPTYRLEKKQDRVRLGGHLINVSCYSIIAFLFTLD